MFAASFSSFACAGEIAIVFCSRLYLSDLVLGSGLSARGIVFRGQREALTVAVFVDLREEVLVLFGGHRLHPGLGLVVPGVLEVQLCRRRDPLLFLGRDLGYRRFLGVDAGAGDLVVERLVFLRILFLLFDRVLLHPGGCLSGFNERLLLEVSLRDGNLLVDLGFRDSDRRSRRRARLSLDELLRFLVDVVQPLVRSRGAEGSSCLC